MDDPYPQPSIKAALLWKCQRFLNCMVCDADCPDVEGEPVNGGQRDCLDGTVEPENYVNTF